MAQPSREELFFAASQSLAEYFVFYEILCSSNLFGLPSMSWAFFRAAALGLGEGEGAPLFLAGTVCLRAWCPEPWRTWVVTRFFVYSSLLCSRCGPSGVALLDHVLEVLDLGAIVP